MDLYRIIGELVEERNRLNRIISSLEEMTREDKKSVRPQRTSRRGRKSMDEKARLEVSERMKRYWKSRREAREKASGSKEREEGTHSAMG